MASLGELFEFRQASRIASGLAQSRAWRRQNRSILAAPSRYG
jgi:hypothetical protein